jgi:hypothetical protein
MASNKFNIHHPKKGEAVIGQFFAAFGFAPDLSEDVELVGQILDKDDNVLAEETALVPPPRWIITFEEEGLSPGKGYKLVVLADGEEVGREEGLEVMIEKFLLISFPGNGGSLCQSNCVSYGTSTETDPVTGTMFNPNTNPPSFGGVTQQGPPNWVVQFPNTIPVIGGYFLAVGDTGGGHDSKQNITVKNC